MQKSQADQKATRKASTNELPMVDLGTVLDFVGKIESDGLQTLTVHEVAKRMGFASATSTPFYRRIVAAKLFGLLDTTQGVNLTKLALDYFKPTDEQSKAAALATGMKNVVAYQKMERFSGKRLPQIDILANLIEREFNLVSETAKVCGSVFVKSAQRAGLVWGDGTLRRRSRNVFPLRLLVKRLHTVRRRFFNPRQRALQYRTITNPTF